MTQIRPNREELIPCSAAVTRLLFFSLTSAAASQGGVCCLDPRRSGETGRGYCIVKLPVITAKCVLQDCYGDELWLYLGLLKYALYSITALVNVKYLEHC